MSLQQDLTRLEVENIVVISHDAVLESMIQLFEPEIQVSISQGSYVERDLSFDPSKPNEIGAFI